MNSSVSASNARFDLRTVLKTLRLCFAPWLAAVLLIVWRGQPGVICMTPFAWLMALWVGWRCAAYSSSATMKQRLIEATVAGAVFGLLQGILFALVSSRMTTADETAQATRLVIVIIVLGTIVGAGLAALNAWLLEHRRARTKKNAA
jgi:hypothetical protein